MLSFHNFLLLNEAKVDDFRTSYPHLKNLSDKHILKYGQKLVKMKDLPDDVEIITSTLNNFDRHGPNLEQKDFHKYGSWDDVNSAIKPKLEKSEKQKVAKKDASVVFHEGPVTVRNIGSHAAACKYGAGTKWCVTSKNDSSFWDTYSVNGKNKMYTIDTTEGKFAYHEGEDGIARDAEDNEVNLTDLTHKYPELLKSKELKNSKWGAFFGNDEKAEEMINSPYESVRSVIAKHPKYAGDLIDDKVSAVRAQVAKHPEHAGKLINDPSELVRTNVAKHPEHAGALINDPDAQVSFIAKKTLERQ